MLLEVDARILGKFVKLLESVLELKDSEKCWKKEEYTNIGINILCSLYYGRIEFLWNLQTGFSNI